MKNYKITEEIINLVESLFEEGYQGCVEMTNSFPSGIAGYLTGCIVFQLSGFCKESLYLAHDLVTNRVVAFGRYSIKGEWEEGEVRVEHIVQIAIDMFDSYSGSGYSLPYEFKDLFIKYGMIEEKVETKTRLVRK